MLQSTAIHLARVGRLAPVAGAVRRAGRPHRLRPGRDTAPSRSTTASRHTTGRDQARPDSRRAGHQPQRPQRLRRAAEVAASTGRTTQVPRQHRTRARQVPCIPAEALLYQYSMMEKYINKNYKFDHPLCVVVCLIF